MRRNERHDELSEVRREARAMLRTINHAVAMIDSGLARYGSSRHALVDALLDVRLALRAHE